MRVKHGKESLVSISRIKDVLDTIVFKQAFRVLNALVDGMGRLKAKNLIGFVAAHSVVSQILELHRRLLDDYIREVIAYLVGQIDYSHILSMQVKDTCIGTRNVIHGGLRSILDMEQRSELIAAKNANLTILPGH